MPSDLGSVIYTTHCDFSRESLQRFIADIERVRQMEVTMPTNYDAANPEHFALMGLTDARLRQEGLSDEDIAALREAQWQAAPASEPRNATMPQAIEAEAKGARRKGTKAD